MSEKFVFVLLLGIVSVDFVLDRLLELLNDKSGKKGVPAELTDLYDQGKYIRSQEYQRINSRFENLTATLGFMATFAGVYAGWFGWLITFINRFSLGEPGATILFFGILYVVSDVWSTPFSWYHTFVIEEKFGFNQMSSRTFWTDKLKGYVLTLTLGGVLLAVLIYLIMWLGSAFWLYFWVILTVLILFLNVFYTSLLLPLFNKLTPLPDGELKRSIQAYSMKVGFPLENIFVMDGSRRSSKGNAFFSGLGKKKKVVLFDTLIEKHTVDELTAIFAHEVGHYKKKHIVMGTVISVFTTGLMLFLLSRMLFNPEVSRALGGQHLSLGLNILAFGILYTPVSRILGLLGNVISRKNEYAADAYAVKTFSSKPLIEGLMKMSCDHLSNLTPHPAYVFVHYSHPPLLQRVRAMKAVM